MQKKSVNGEAKQIWNKSLTTRKVIYFEYTILFECGSPILTRSILAFKTNIILAIKD